MLIYNLRENFCTAKETIFLLTINKLKKEAFKFRGLLEKCDKSKTELVPDCFPIMSCKISSMLLSYHFLKLWPELEVKGISAIAEKNDQITHYWLEIDEIVIDITGDQYNLIKGSELNKEIVSNRPFKAVHVSNKMKVIYMTFSNFEKVNYSCTVFLQSMKVLLRIWSLITISS
ncbi:hypothetical protein HORIV_40370 [Vreelandella olivaria]|uniref:Microcin J25-processing protein McjB C-terminal domain-containing protein n=1 Tax=Vreelandella olivaria TaxID=390919 RepID=A0ABN5X4C0_9GAMM|nr:hypothetical protein HORIV_40370 [Halomonas olivaria]